MYANPVLGPEFVWSQNYRRKLLLDGFTYGCQKTAPDRTYWICDYRKCRGARVITNSKDEVLKRPLLTDHVHPPELFKQEVLRAKSLLKERSLNTKESITNVLQSVLAEVSPDVAPYLPSVACLKRTIQRQREVKKPPPPPKGHPEWFLKVIARLPPEVASQLDPSSLTLSQLQLLAPELFNPQTAHETGWQANPGSSIDIKPIETQSVTGPQLQSVTGPQLQTVTNPIAEHNMKIAGTCRKRKRQMEHGQQEPGQPVDPSTNSAQAVSFVTEANGDAPNVSLQSFLEAASSSTVNAQKECQARPVDPPTSGAGMITRIVPDMPPVPPRIRSAGELVLDDQILISFASSGSQPTPMPGGRGSLQRFAIPQVWKPVFQSLIKTITETSGGSISPSEDPTEQDQSQDSSMRDQNSLLSTEDYGSEDEYGAIEESLEGSNGSPFSFSDVSMDGQDADAKTLLANLGLNPAQARDSAQNAPMHIPSSSTIESMLALHGMTPSKGAVVFTSTGEVVLKVDPNNTPEVKTELEAPSCNVVISTGTPSSETSELSAEDAVVLSTNASQQELTLTKGQLTPVSSIPLSEFESSPKVRSSADVVGFDVTRPWSCPQPIPAPNYCVPQGVFHNFAGAASTTTSQISLSQLQDAAMIPSSGLAIPGTSLQMLPGLSGFLPMQSTSIGPGVDPGLMPPACFSSAVEFAPGVPSSSQQMLHHVASTSFNSPRPPDLVSLARPNPAYQPPQQLISLQNDALANNAISVEPPECEPSGNTNANP